MLMYRWVVELVHNLHSLLGRHGAIQSDIRVPAVEREGGERGVIHTQREREQIQEYIL